MHDPEKSPGKCIGSYLLYCRAFKVQYLYRFSPHPPSLCHHNLLQGHACKLVQFQALILHLMLAGALHVLHVLHIEEMPVKANTRISYERTLCQFLMPLIDITVSKVKLSIWKQNFHISYLSLRKPGIISEPIWICLLPTFSRFKSPFDQSEAYDRVNKSLTVFAKIS